jgi:hypothetical protein
VRARLVAGFGQSFAHLDDEQRAALLAAAIGIARTSSRAIAIEGLTAGLESLHTGQRTQLVDSAVALKNKPHRARAITALAERAPLLTETQGERIVEMADDRLSATFQNILLENLIIGSKALVNDR